MFDITGDLFTQEGVIVITTNGFIKSNGCAVLGRGCAAQAVKYHPELPSHLGKLLREYGNSPYPFQISSCLKPYDWLVTFPVKPASVICAEDKSNVVKHKRSIFKPGDPVPGWASVADREIIETSAHLLLGLAGLHGWEKITLPRPGCGFGELEWSQVKPLLEPILDDRFSCITFKETVQTPSAAHG